MKRAEASNRGKGGKVKDGGRDGALGAPLVDKPLAFVSTGILDNTAAPPEDDGRGDSSSRRGIGGSGGLEDVSTSRSSKSGKIAAFGGFEAHTSGFGSKMLSKMGFAGAGAGIGKSDQGRAEPINAVQRPKGLGLGAGS
ncbi:hypothetical protein CYMTET_5264 [Cymbomonas tetramitiformis]|uniref:G-patch domain-containing protein n=1 Tax=Cymbomonas tetramitiformis TaxID=36881 RepID=A0AAE0GZW2_9CHLO|nr:hypothetical protein CYMTET_5264 [Cymbomonas tetramitiformis]